MLGPNTPATLLVLAASILLLLVTISTPIFRSIYFLSFQLTPSNALSTAATQNGVNQSDLVATIKLGLFGYCIQLGSRSACSSPQYGYSLDPASLIPLPFNFNIDTSTWLPKALTYPLIVHPIASGLGFLSAISGLISHFREFSRSRFTSWLSSIASTIALGAFIFDILAFSLGRSRINNITNPNFSLNAQLGNAIWITLAGWVSLVFSGCFFCAGRRIHARRQRDQSQSHLIRPELDQDYNSKMREQAEKAEQAREKASTPQPNRRNLPAFAEYTDQDGSNQEHIPLNSFQSDDAISHHAQHPERHDGEALEGVGAGYGRRQEQRLARQPSMMSQATGYSHASYSQLPPVPLMPEPTRPYHNPYSSPSNYDSLSSPPIHNQVSDLYRNLPAHVTPASNSMHPPSRSNSSNQSYQTNSMARRLPQSLIPAGMPATGGVIAYDAHRAWLPGSSYSASPPSSQTQMYGLPQSNAHPSFPPSQSAMSGLTYLSPHPQPDRAADPHPKLLNPEQRQTLNYPPLMNSPSDFAPPIYQPTCNPVDLSDHDVPRPLGSSETPNDGVVHGYSEPFQIAQQSSQHDDPFTQTYDLGPHTRDAHLTAGAAAVLAHDQINHSSHLLSPQQELDEDGQSRGDTDYTIASYVGSSTEQPPLEKHTSRRELPQVPTLSPLLFPSPPASPLYPRNNVVYSGTSSTGFYDQGDASHPSPV